MGSSASKIKIPGKKYIKNFNIENRVMKKLETQETAEQAMKMSPRHPSTIERFKQREEKAPKIDELSMNKKVIDAIRTVKVSSQGDDPRDPRDKRPRKENESFYAPLERKIDVDFEKYGYPCPEKIRPGHLSLRQFDEFLNSYKENKSVDLINQFAAKNNVTSTNLHILLEYYKPFSKIETKKAANLNKPKEIAADPVKQIFPNLK